MKIHAPSRRGSALMLTMPLVLSIFVVAIALFRATTTSSKVSNSSWEKVQADALAEAGINALYSQMANVAAGATTVNGTPMASTTLSGKAGSTSTADGTYSADIVSTATSVVGGQTNYTYVIEGTGVAPNGTTKSKARASFTMTESGMTGFSLGNSAIKTNGNVVISGGSGTQDNSGKDNASVLANGSISDSSSGLSIQGTASYYKTSSLTGKAFAVVPLTTPMSFPSAATTASWQATWLSQAEEATTSHPSGNIVNGNVSYGSNGSLTAPEYISGNLTVSGGHTLTLNVDPSAPTPCVVFVGGSVTVSGGSSLINNGVLLVSVGTQTYSGTSAVYSAANMVNCGLISFSTNSTNAISITGGSGVAAMGVVYAVNGGMTLSGGTVFQGSLTCGGSSSTVTMSGGSYVRYQNGWDSAWAPFAPSYTSSNLSHWVRTL